MGHQIHTWQFIIGTSVGFSNYMHYPIIGKEYLKEPKFSIGNVSTSQLNALIFTAYCSCWNLTVSSRWPFTPCIPGNRQGEIAGLVVSLTRPRSLWRHWRIEAAARHTLVVQCNQLLWINFVVIINHFQTQGDLIPKSAVGHHDTRLL